MAVQMVVTPAELPAGVPPEIASPIQGDPATIRAAGQKFIALGHQLLSDYQRHMGTKDDTVFEDWAGQSADLGVTAFGLARARVDKGSKHLQSAGDILVRFASKLEAAIDSQDAALQRLVRLKTEQAAAGPATGGAPVTGQPLDASITSEVAKAESAIHEATMAHHQVNTELRALMESDPFPVSDTFLKHHPLQAIVLEQMVATKKLTAKEAEAVAGHMAKLSKKEGAIFYSLVIRAGSESQRAALYKGLDRGNSIKHLEAITTQYANPLKHAHITKVGRIDQGVDYTGTGTIGSLGAGIITEVQTSNSGWPGGGYIQYKLTSGPYAGKYVYVAEDVSPVAGLHVGEHITAGQPLAHLHGGMEMGFAAGPGQNNETWARVHGGGYVEGQRTAAGDAFSHLLHVTGAPPGHAEGRAPVGHAPAPTTVPPPHQPAPHHARAHHAGTGSGTTTVDPGSKKHTAHPGKHHPAQGHHPHGGPGTGGTSPTVK